VGKVKEERRQEKKKAHKNKFTETGI